MPGQALLGIASGLSVPLTSLFLTYREPGTIMDRCAPIKRVTLRSGPFPKEDLKDIYQDNTALIGPDGSVDETEFNITSGNYSVRDYGRKKVTTPDKIKEAAALGINQELADTRHLNRLMAREREIRGAAIIFNAANYGANVAAAATTWDVAGAKPLNDFSDAKRKLLNMSARKVVVMGPLAWDAFKFSEQVLDALGRPGGQTSRAIAEASKEDAAKILEVDEVLVGEMQFDSANRGQPGLVRSFIWGKFAAILVCPTEEQLNAEVEIAAHTVTFRMIRDEFPEQTLAGIPFSAVVRRYQRQEKGLLGVWETVAGYSEDIKTVEPEAGFLITSPIP